MTNGQEEREIINRVEAIELLGISEKAFDNYRKYSGELNRIEGQRFILFYKDEIERFKALKDSRTINLTMREYETCFQFAIKVVYGGAALHGIRGTRSEVQAADDWILGILAEHAFKKFLSEKFNTEIRLDNEVHPGNITAQDVVGIEDGENIRRPRVRVGIKASKMKNAYLVLSPIEVEAEDRHSDIYIFARVGLPSDHLFRILRDHSFFRDVSRWLQGQENFRSIEALEEVPVWITGYAEAENLDSVGEIPGQIFDGMRYVKQVSQLRNSDADWRRFIEML